MKINFYTALASLLIAILFSCSNPKQTESDKSDLDQEKPLQLDFEAITNLLLNGSTGWGESDTCCVTWTI